MMTPRENLLSSLRRQGYEKPPLDCGAFCPSQLEAFKQRFGHADYRTWFNAPHRFVSLRMDRQFADARALYPRETPPPDTDFDAWGVGHSHQADCHHMTRMHHPLAGDPTLDEIKHYPLPTIAAQAENEILAQVASLHQQGLAVLGGMACTVWEIAWYLRSMEDLMADMMTDDERAHVHISRVTDNAVQRIRACARAGCDLIQLGDDIGMQHSIMMSLDLWRKWIKPQLARIIAAGREIKPDLLIFYHSCGYVIPFLDDLIEAGVDVLNPVQPECMDFGEVHRLTGSRLSYWGSIGTQTTLPFGTPQEVKEAAWSRLRTCGKQGGIIVGPTHMVEPEVPWENLVAMKEAVEEFKG